jgi:hypothetical protein
MNILTDTNLGDLVTDTLAQLFQGSAFGGATNESIYFSFSWPTQVLQESIYQNSWTPTNPTGSMMATEYISDLTNAIPVLGKYYNPSGSTVPDMYDLILTEYTVPDDGSSQLAKRAAPTNAVSASSAAPAPPSPEMAMAALPDLQLAAQDLQVLDPVAVPNTPAPVALTAPTDAYLQQLAAEQQAANEQARNNLERLQQGLPVMPPPAARVAARGSNKLLNNFVAATNPSILKATGDSSLEAAFRKAQVVFIGTQLASSRYPMLTFHATDIYPADFADPAAAAAWPVFSMTYQLTHPIPQTVTVSFRFCRVDMVRAWMLPYLFNLQGWGMQGQVPGCLSTGSSTSNAGMFPLLPVSLIMGRDMTVVSQTGDIRYSSPGLQVLARVSKVLPAMPG